MASGNDGSITVEIWDGLKELLNEALVRYPDTSLGFIVTKTLAASASNVSIPLPDLTQLEGVVLVLERTSSNVVSVKPNGIATAFLVNPMFVMSITSTYPLSSLTGSNASSTASKDVIVVGLQKGT